MGDFKIIDFMIGFTLMNAMPHLLFGIMKVRFFSAFGYSPSGNLIYAIVNIIIAISLAFFSYGLDGLMKNGIVIGAISMFFIYCISGKFFVKLFEDKSKKKEANTFLD